MIFCCRAVISFTIFKEALNGLHFHAGRAHQIALLHSGQTLHFHLNLLLASPEPINKAAECVILHDANCSADDKKKQKKPKGGEGELLDRRLPFDPRKLISLEMKAECKEK